MKIAISFLICVLATSLTASAQPKRPASFEPGSEVEIGTVVVGSQGARFNTGNKGTPVDNIEIAFPAGAVVRDTTIKLSYNTGKLTLNSGRSSGVFMRLKAGNLLQFNEPVTITVTPAKSGFNAIPVGYAIDGTGRLSALSGLGQPKHGKTAFDTFVPLLFTYILAPR